MPTDREELRTGHRKQCQLAITLRSPSKGQGVKRSLLDRREGEHFPSPGLTSSYRLAEAGSPSRADQMVAASYPGRYN